MRVPLSSSWPGERSERAETAETAETAERATGLPVGRMIGWPNGGGTRRCPPVEPSTRRRVVLFKDVTFYLAAIPSYVGGVMAYGWATDEADHRKTGLAKLAQRYIDAEIGTEYYTPEIHQAAFALPLHIQKMLTREL